MKTLKRVLDWILNVFLACVGVACIVLAFVMPTFGKQFLFGITGIAFLFSAAAFVKYTLYVSQLEKQDEDLKKSFLQDSLTEKVDE